MVGAGEGEALHQPGLQNAVPGPDLNRGLAEQYNNTVEDTNTPILPLEAESGLVL